MKRRIEKNFPAWRRKGAAEKTAAAFLKLLAVALSALLACSLASGENKKVIENIDYLYMHIGLPMDYPLPERFKKEQLKFSGNYKKYTSAVYRKESHDIRFAPKRRGSAVLVIKNRKNKIIASLHLDIQKDNLHKIAAELRDLLIAVDGIEVKIYNKKVIIDGQVLLPREMARIKNVIAQYNPQQVQSLVTYSPEAQKKIAELIEKEIDYPEVSVRYAYNRFLLEGCVASPDEEKRAMSLANLYTQFDTSSVGEQAKKRNIYIVKNDLKVPCESVKKAQSQERQKKKEKKDKLVQVVVHFVEMMKSFNKGFLFQWAPALGDQGTQVTGSLGNTPGAPSGISAVLTATVANFFPKLNWAKSFDFARVLHNSSILVEEGSGGTIETSVTTEPKTQGDVRISGGIQSQVNTTIEKLKIKGERENMVWMRVNIKVSSVHGAGSTANRSVSTNLSVRDGSSAVIGGIISSSLTRDYNKSPLGSPDRPILNLISAKNYNTNKSQFVVFITPAIKSSASAGVERIKQKFKLDE